MLKNRGRLLPMLNAKDQSGFIIVETLINLAIGLVILISVVSICITLIRHSYQYTQLNQLELRLNNAVNTIATDLKRAGFWNSAYLGINQNLIKNPHMLASTKLSLNASNNCVLLSYDLNKDGLVPSTNEYYGFRLVAGELQAKTDSGNYNCNSTTGGWLSITDPKNIFISSLNLSLQNSSANNQAGIAVYSRNLTIQLTGNLVNAPNISRTITKTVHIYNNLYQP